jgi:3-methyladenine DNA glycosylase/8-oxoguanine DNA glycosylase
MAAAGPPRLRRSQESHLVALVRAIVYQQLAGAAVAAIHHRLLIALDNNVRPEALLALSDQSLRTVGLSANKGCVRAGPGDQGARREGRPVPARSVPANR